MEGELLDWEVLHTSDSDSSSIHIDSLELRNLDEIEGDTDGIIRSDYFSFDNHSIYGKEGDVNEEGSVESIKPSWIDSRPDTRFERKETGKFWSDSGSDWSDDRKFSDFDALGSADNEKAPICFEGIGETGAIENLSKLELDNSKFSELGGKQELGLGEIHVDDKDMDGFWSDSGGDGLVSMKFEDAEKESDMGSGDCIKNGGEFENSGELDDGNKSTVELEGGEDNPVGTVKSIDEGDKKKVVWWKVPFEFLRYCVFKVSSIWSFSIAAAVMGFVILGHKLYKMKRKTRSLQLKVTMDNKKVSQLMTRAARLNEAFSVVRRVPIIRSSLPTAGVNPWPVMSLR